MTNLLDLPDEILQHIFNCVQEDATVEATPREGYFPMDQVCQSWKLAPLPSICKRLYAAGLEALYHNVWVDLSHPLHMRLVHTIRSNETAALAVRTLHVPSLASAYGPLDIPPSMFDRMSLLFNKCSKLAFLDIQLNTLQGTYVKNDIFSQGAFDGAVGGLGDFLLDAPYLVKLAVSGSSSEDEAVRLPQLRWPPTLQSLIVSNCAIRAYPFLRELPVAKPTLRTLSLLGCSFRPTYIWTSDNDSEEQGYLAVARLLDETIPQRLEIGPVSIWRDFQAILLPRVSGILTSLTIRLFSIRGSLPTFVAQLNTCQNIEYLGLQDFRGHVSEPHTYILDHLDIPLRSLAIELKGAYLPAAFFQHLSDWLQFRSTSKLVELEVELCRMMQSCIRQA